MTLLDQQTDHDIELRDRGLPQAWLAAGQPQCECPDFCPVQHDSDN